MLDIFCVGTHMCYKYHEDKKRVSHVSTNMSDVQKWKLYLLLIKDFSLIITLICVVLHLYLLNQARSHDIDWGGGVLIGPFHGSLNIHKKQRLKKMKKNWEIRLQCRLYSVRSHWRVLVRRFFIGIRLEDIFRLQKPSNRTSLNDQRNNARG